MNMRRLITGLLVAASVQAMAPSASAEKLVLVDIKLPIKKAGTDSDVPADTIAEIRVDGLQKGPYTKVLTKSLDYIVAARGDRHKTVVGDVLFGLTLDNDGNGGGNLSEEWKYFALTRDYIDPRATGIEGKRVSPIDLCNAKLNATQGSARAAFLKKGTTFLHKEAYEITGEASADLGRILHQAEESETIRVPVKIVCMPLNQPKPRENSDTKPAPSRPGKPMKPTISKVALRIEPAAVVQNGQYLCPTKLKLYGTVDVIREFHGQALFVGPHYLSNITPLDTADKGHRNVTGTYPVDWSKKGGGLVAKPNAAPAKQTLSFRFNVADKDGKVLESAEETVSVSCRKIEVNAPAVGGGMTIQPSN